MPNGNTDYKLGEHESAIMEMRSDIKEIKKDVRDLNVWRWRVVGVVSGLAFGGNLLADLIIKSIK